MKQTKSFLKKNNIMLHSQRARKLVFFFFYYYYPRDTGLMPCAHLNTRAALWPNLFLNTTLRKTSSQKGTHGRLHIVTINLSCLRTSLGQESHTRLWNPTQCFFSLSLVWIRRETLKDCSCSWNSSWLCVVSSSNKQSGESQLLQWHRKKGSWKFEVLFCFVFKGREGIFVCEPHRVPEQLGDEGAHGHSRS